MAAITQNTVQGVNGPVTLTRTTLGASDTLTYIQGSLLFLYNTTASPVDVTIDGSGATTVSPTGYGGTVSLTAGKVVTVPASGSVALKLDTVSLFLSGTIAVTGGTGVIAHLYK